MYLLFDIGGTKTRIARSLDLATFDEPVVLRTPENFDEAMELYRQTAAQLTEDRPLLGVAGGVPGAHSKDGVLEHWANHAQWEGKPIIAGLKKAFGTDNLFVRNDAALVGLGEATAGAGKGYDIVVYLTVSTGVGGTRIVHGAIDESAMGFEPGHQIIAGPNGPIELEKAASGTALHTRTGKHPKDVPQNDPIWDEIAGYLAEGLHNIMVLWSPQAIVLGGSMMVGDPFVPIPSIERELAKLPQIFEHEPKLIKAALGDFGGLWGALHLLKTVIPAPAGRRDQWRHLWTRIQA